jgi:hypothetical protein
MLRFAFWPEGPFTPRLVPGRGSSRIRRRSHPTYCPHVGDSRPPFSINTGRWGELLNNPDREVHPRNLPLIQLKNYAVIVGGVFDF